MCLPHQAAKISANEKNSKIPQEIPCRIRAAIRMCVISIVISLPHFKLKIQKNKNQAVCVKMLHLLDLSASLFSSRSNPPPLQASRSRSSLHRITLTQRLPLHHAHAAILHRITLTQRLPLHQASRLP